MDIIIFLFISLSLLLLLFTHSYRLRGFFVTLNFFFFAFLLIFTKGESPGLSFINLDIKPKILSVGLSLATACLGLSVLYASWLAAEKLTQVFYRLKEKILPVTLISGVICACFIYLIGVTTVYLGWWQKDQGALLFVILQWFFFCVYFLSAFFLIVHSKFKKYDWKTIFFILPFIPAWCFRIFKEGQVLFLIEYIVLILLISLLFFTNLRFDYSEKLKE